MESHSSEDRFGSIVREHKSTIYTVCYMFSNDADEVADLFQDILINIWKGLPQFAAQADLRTWIYRISLNTCISAQRKQRRRRDNVPLTMDINPYEDADTDSRQAQMLRSRIQRLKPFDRAIVLLWLENLSYDEIGSIVGLTAKNVGVRLYRIKEELKKMS